MVFEVAGEVFEEEFAERQAETVAQRGRSSEKNARHSRRPLHMQK